MRTNDWAPLYRSTVGFDRLFDLLDQATRVEPMNNWPPYNIEKVADDQYRITMAVAGFGEDDLELLVQENVLTVRGKASEPENGVTYLHRGIARRAFEHRFQLADFVRVAGAKLANGLLDIELVREVPESMKPRRIAINHAGGPEPKVIEGQKTEQKAAA